MEGLLTAASRRAREKKVGGFPWAELGESIAVYHTLMRDDSANDSKLDDQKNTHGFARMDLQNHTLTTSAQ
jgi:hypothetical protein